MKIITFEELQQLNTGDRFGAIKKGDYYPYIFASLHPLKLNIVIAIDSGKYTNAVTFGKYDSSIFVSGKYDSEFIGKIIINQLNEEIEIVKNVYVGHE